ncbi:MAG: hypothetical protein AAF548_06810 [Actinomycetota bacterium]
MNEPVDLDAVRREHRRTRRVALTFSAVLAGLTAASLLLPDPMRWAAVFSTGTLTALCLLLVGGSLRLTTYVRLRARARLLNVPIDRPSSRRRCAVCAAPLQAVTWHGGRSQFPPLKDSGARCDQCGGPTQPATQRAAIIAERQALLAAIDAD